MKANSVEVFKDAPVPKAVFLNAIPSIVSMIMVLIYNLADAFFIGRTGDGDMFTAVSLVTPAFLIFMAIGMLFGIGGTSLVSRKLGEGDEAIAKKVSSFCFWTGAVLGVIFMVLILVFIEPICRLIGASDQTLPYTKSYFSIVSIALPFLIVSNAFSNIIRAEGKANVAMIGMIIGNMLNVVLDPIMISVLDWGIAGAAVATVVGNVAATLFYFFHIISKNSIFSISLKDYAFRNGILSNVLKIGLPASLNNILMSLSNIVVNNFMQGFCDDAVGGLGVAFKVNTITVMLLIGLGTGIQPLLGYCYGARNVKRFESVIKFSVVVAFIMSIVMSLISFLLSGPLVRAFIEVESQVGYGTAFVKILVISGPILGLLFVMINALQAMGAAIPSLILSASRQGIIYLPLLLVINALTESENMLVLTQPITDYLAVILAVVLFIITFKKFKKRVDGENLTKVESPKDARDA
ncbi:MAG: MATE family efflux transporter [Clostridia bacterium]|nr:MATE family efflux transporter [Clostridia bacterium]